MKNIHINVCDKNADRIYADIVLFCIMQTTVISPISLQNFENERKIKKIVDKTFEETDTF